MSDKKSTKAEVATNSQTAIKSSEVGDKEKTPIIDTPLVEDIAKESAEDSIHNEAISEIENTLEDSTKVAVEIDENSEEKSTDASESDKGQASAESESVDDENEEVNSSDDEVHDEDDVEVTDQKEYHNLSPKELISELETLLKTKSIQQLKHEVDDRSSCQCAGHTLLHHGSG